MKRRHFLRQLTQTSIGALGVVEALALSTTTAQAETKSPLPQQTILTLVGAIDRTNRGKSDPLSDQLMHKFNIHFERGYEFSFAELGKLTQVTISPTMEYDAKVHQLSGPRLVDILNVAGVKKSPNTRLLFHGIDGYAPEISWKMAEQYNFIVAMKMDGKALSIGGFGPLFAIYDADRIEEMAAKPLAQRFQLCPWGLYCIEISN